MHRLGNFTLLQILDSGIILRLELVYFEIRRTGVRVCHLSSVSLGLGILGIETRSHLEGHGTVLDFSLQRIQCLEGLLSVLVSVRRLDENMACIEHIALFLENFNDMESVRSLHNLRNDARFQ